MKIKRLLIVEDDSTLRLALSRALTKSGYSVTTATTQAEALTWLNSQADWDSLLLDLQLPDGSGLSLLSEIQKKSKPIPTIVLTGHGSIENAIESTQKGAAHFLVKPVSLDDIMTCLNSIMQNKLNTTNSSVTSTPAQPLQTTLSPQPTAHYINSPTKSHKSMGIIGKSMEIQQVLDLATRVAESDATILIQGESGTGKELIARAIHQMSPRKNFPFIAINCGAIPSELLESELFGHMKGAFTGAIANRVGRFEMADGGILFLDEIGDMSPTLQVKILRALQERSFEPVGSTKSVHVNVQVIAATHINLEKAVQEGRFREDLFYRLNVIPIQVPSLRERKTDIPILIEHFLNQFSQRRKSQLLGFSADALESLSHYAWPGNIRELENLVERMSIIKGKGFVELKDLPDKYHSKSQLLTLAEPTPPEYELPTDGIDFNSAVDQFENNLIIKALEKTGWNRNQASLLLKLNRTTLVEKMKKKGIKQPDDSPNSSIEDQLASSPLEQPSTL